MPISLANRRTKSRSIGCGDVGWLTIVSAITLICSPALSIPCGFTREGLPVGLQIVAAPRGESRVLAAGKLLEDIFGLRNLTPIDPRPAP